VAEFQEVMQQAKRICKYMDNKCTLCPLTTKPFCQMGASEMENFADTEHVIMAWAAEHPEPVYPTWGEWLMSIGVINGVHPHGAIDALGNLKQPIPADIAMKLGLQPKGES